MLSNSDDFQAMYSGRCRQLILMGSQCPPGWPYPPGDAPPEAGGSGPGFSQAHPAAPSAVGLRSPRLQGTRAGDRYTTHVWGPAAAFQLQAAGGTSRSGGLGLAAGAVGGCGPSPFLPSWDRPHPSPPGTSSPDSTSPAPPGGPQSTSPPADKQSVSGAPRAAPPRAADTSQQHFTPGPSRH